MIAFLAVALAEPVVDALVAELDRSGSLSLPDAPPLYGLRYHYGRFQQVELIASLGAVLHENAQPANSLGVELRVGTPAFDNTGFGGWENGFNRGRLALSPTPVDTQQIAWRLTDIAFKQAIEQFARKTAQFTPPPDYPGDYVPPAVVVAVDGSAAPFDPAPARELALALSKALEPAGAKLLRGESHLGIESGDVWLIDRAGTRLQRPMGELSLRVLASLRTDDGETLTDSRLWSILPDQPLPEALPEVIAMRDALVARASAPKLSEEYVGPVVFEGHAALDLYRYLLLNQLEGTPAEIPFDTWFGDLGETTGSVRVGRRVLPEGYTVDDDPQRLESHPSTYAHDWEGNPAQRVELVDDGIVKDLLMSAVPRKKLTPNGHGRGFMGTRATGKATQLQVTPNRHRPSRALYRRALKMAAAYGLDHAIVIRRLQEYSVRSLDGSHSASEGTHLPPPVEIVRIRRDGSEEILRGAEFASVQRFVLRDIAMAGPERTTTVLAPRDGSWEYLNPIEGMATWIAGPDVLVREMELVPATTDPRDKPVLLPPTP